MEMVVSLLQEYEIPNQSAWGKAVQFVPEITPEAARLLMEAAPENAAPVTGHLPHRLQEQSEPGAVMEALSNLPAERQNWFARWGVQP
jgi:hypothetical protein